MGNLISIQRLKELLNYDPDTGEFTWRVGKRGLYAGDIAGCIAKHHYRVIRLDNKLYYAHRLAFFWSTGRWPKYVDHKNRCTLDNRFSNLREASMSENLMNARRPRNNTTGYKGVWFDKNVGRYRAEVSGDHIPGFFVTAKEAHEAYMVEAKKRFGEFARSE